jgi:hypothetical protein
MSFEQDLQGALDGIKDDVAKVADKVAAQTDLIKQLQDQIGKGVPVTQEQLDALVDEAQAIKASLDAVSQ